MAEHFENLSKEESNPIVPLRGMFEEYFLDYASYVILERAVPLMEDGLKPVHRRILHAMYTMEDGRYNKVANIIGQTMQFHPHGDASIGEALVGLGQKDLLIDTQGNWGDVNTGDTAAAPRYIEARLSKFALEILFNPDTTTWQATYDSRKKEPVFLPVKFPLLLAQGVEGIAVGLSTKILPHNFIELLDACIAHLKGKKFKLYPDFQTGGSIDVSQYQSGMRGGKILSRASIEVVDRNFIRINQLPFGVTTDKLIESILKANDKGQIKVKKVVDNTAKDVDITIELMAGISPEQTVEALYHFSDCSISISPLSCVILNDVPVFLPVEDILKINVENTKDLLLKELELKRDERSEKWFFTSLEKIFIEQRIYRDIEECTTWEEVMNAVDDGLAKFVKTPSNPKPAKLLADLFRDITQEDITKLTEVRIKKISKYSSFETDEELKKLSEEIEKIKFDIEHIVDFTIAWFKHLKDKYGKGKERKTEITTFDSVDVTQVVQNNAKLYVNRAEGFVGMGLKKDEFVTDCSTLDDVIAFTSDAKFVVTRIGEKTFVGKNIIHVAIWSKNDDRTTYNLVYSDGTGTAFAKRFNVTAITRDKEYDLTKDAAKPKLHYFSVNPNGEAEMVKVVLSPTSRAKNKIFDFDFADLAIKGRSSQGNIVTKYPVKKITLVSKGESTLDSKEIFYDPVFGRLNFEGIGRSLGKVEGDNKVLVIYKNGTLELIPIDLTLKIDQEDIFEISKWDKNDVISAIYFDGIKNWTVAKRFIVEKDETFNRFKFITDHPKSELFLATKTEPALIEYDDKVRKDWVRYSINVYDFVDVKGWKSLGNKLSNEKIRKLTLILPDSEAHTNHDAHSDQIYIGDTIEFDLDEEQGSLFD